MKTSCRRSDRLRVVALDVTKPESIAAAIKTAGPIDVLVNNAGIGVVGAFEATPMATAREVFETNTFGVMAMMQAVVPQFRERKSGVIVNVTSSVTLAAMPLAGVYTASKTAIEGLTGSVAFELAAFNIRVKLVEPGYAPTTAFTSNGGCAHGRTDSRSVCGFRGTHLRRICTAGSGDNRGRRGRGGVACCERFDRTAPIPGGCGRGSAC